jgi:AcrR family transcriptional regulator
MGSGAEQSIKRVLPRGRNALDREVVLASQRARLLEAMCELAAREGFAAVTIARLVARAGVAKPAFYDSFESKEACFIALFDECVQQMMGAIAAALDPHAAGDERVRQGLTAFVEFIAADDDRARVMLVEPPAAGLAAARRLEEALETLASFYRSLREELRANHPKVPALSPARARAIVGAINGPVASVLRNGHARDVLTLRDELVDVVTLLAADYRATR